MAMKALHHVVIEALDLHASCTRPALRFCPSESRLVVGSGNALPTGRIVFGDKGVVFADEGQVERVLEQNLDLDSAVVVSASGGSHAPIAVQLIRDRKLPCYLLTCQPTSPAADLLDPLHVVVTPANSEPITYNTSTYLGMILAKTGEDPAQIKQYLTDDVLPRIRDMSDARAFYLIVPAAYDVVRPMFLTKFDELFGGRLNGRCYTLGQTLHAKTVIPWDKEMFIGLDYENQLFGTDERNRLNFAPFPSRASYGAMMAIGYYVIGHIQAQFPDWFMQYARRYEQTRGGLFKACLS